MWLQQIKEQAPRIQSEALSGDKLSKDVITYYEMHRVCPMDPGAAVVAEETFKKWQKAKAEGVSHG